MYIYIYTYIHIYIYIHIHIYGSFRLSRGQKRMFGLGYVSVVGFEVCFGACFEVCILVLGS